MNEADKIRMKSYEQQIDMLEKENKALRKELFKYKLKDGEVEVQDHTVDSSAQDILNKIRERRAYKKKKDFGTKILDTVMGDWE